MLVADDQEDKLLTEVEDEDRLRCTGLNKSGYSRCRPCASNRFEWRSWASTYTIIPLSSALVVFVLNDAWVLALAWPSGEFIGRFCIKYSANSLVSLMSRLSRALVTMRTVCILDRTRVRPVQDQREFQIDVMGTAYRAVSTSP